MKKYFALAAIPVLLLAAIAVSQSFGIFGQWFRGNLISYQEVPAVSSLASATFDADISYDESTITWRLSYANLEADIVQSHIHFGQPGVNGAIPIWLCSNLPSPPTPAGTQPCPPPPATITGFITSNQVTAGAASQGISQGELNEVIRAMRAGVTYANIHTTKYPGGEIRSQLKPGKELQNGF